MIKKFLAIISFISLFIIGNSQDINYSFKSGKKITQYQVDILNRQTGLPTNSLTDICQTSDGYIWMSSYDGLIRYNGKNYTIYNSLNTKFLNENGILSLQEAKDSTLWIISQNNGLLSYKNGKLISHLKTNNDSLKELQQFSFIDKKGRIWISNAIGNIYYYYKGKFTEVKQLNFIRLANFAQDKDSIFWIATFGKGLIKFDLKKSTLKYYTEKEGLNSNWINNLYFDKQNTLWIETDDGVNIMKDNTISSIPEMEGIAVYDINQDHTNNYWFACNNGIYVYFIKDKTFQHLDNTLGLPFNFSKKIIIDKENTLWIISYKKGLSKLKNSKFSFFNKTDGIKANLVNTIFQIDNNNILIGFDNGKIYKLDLKTYQINEFKTKIDLTNIRIRNIFFDSKKNYWISTYSGLLKIDKNGNEKWQEGLPGRYFRIVYEDSKKNIWIGTRNNGVIKIDTNGQKTIFDQNNGIIVNLVMVIKEDKKGNIFIGTSKGGLSIIKDDKVIKNYTQENGLNSNIIFDIYIDKDDIIWLATNGGLNCIINNKAYSIKNEENYFQDTPFTILEDDSSNFWLTSNEGIMKVSKKEVLDYLFKKRDNIDVKLYNEKDGLQQPECNSTANSLKDLNGNLWFPTTAGIGMINPNDIEKNLYIPPVYINMIKVDTATIHTDSISSIILKPETQRITFYFCSLSYYDPESNLFQYKLIGYDKQWSSPTKDYSVTYTNLPPGNYELQVKGCNNEGLWNPQIATLKFTIKPHFYQTIFFYIIIIILALLLTYLFFRWRVTRLRRKQQILEELVKKRTEEVTERNEELRQQNHEIKAQNEKIAAQSHELSKLSIVASETDNIVMIFDQNHKLIWFNTAYSEKYDDINRTIILDKLYLNKKLKTHLDKCIITKSSTTFEAKRRNKKQKLVWVQCTLTPIIKNNEIFEFILIESDITRLKKVHFALALKKKYITESILYASNIQDAIFPDKEKLQKYFNVFIIYKPKDIVSGDFYWFEDITDKYKILDTSPNEPTESIKNCSVLALVDCTGHGVPGAFMSMLGYVLLNEIIIHRKIFDPQFILNELDKNIRILLKQDKGVNTESMDIALCRITRYQNKNVKITFAGAKLSMIIYEDKNNSVKIIKGDRKTIGGFLLKNIDYNFLNNEIELQPKDKIYLTTDGYLDQVNTKKRRLGTYNFIKIIEQNGNKPMKQQNYIFSEIIKKWQFNEIQRDDITLISIEF